MDDLLKRIDEIITSFDEISSEYGDAPIAGSQYINEIETFPDKPRINEPFTFGKINLKAGKELLSVMPSLTQGENVFSNPVTARAVLESSALALWFLSPNIDATERVKRGLIQLCDGKNQIRKFHRENGEMAEVARIDDFFANRLPTILGSNGITFQNNAGAQVEPQTKKPTIIDMIGDTLGAEFRSAYRILSGFAHGQQNILIAFGYDFANAVGSNGMKEVEFKPNHQITLYSFSIAVKGYKTALESYFAVSNWDFSKINPIFENFFAALSDAIKKNRS